MNSIVYCCPFVPAEWIAAHGLRPMRIVPEWERGECGMRSAECGMNGEGEREGETERHGDKETRGQGDGGMKRRRDRGKMPQGVVARERGQVEAYAGICPFARAFAGSALAVADRDAGIVVTTACDQMRRIADWLMERSARPVFLLNVPATCTPAARGLYASELERLSEFLVRLGGERPSDEKLAQVMVEYEAVRRSAGESVWGGLSGAMNGSREGIPAQGGARRDSRTSEGRDSRTSDGNRSPILERMGHPVPLALVGGPLLREDFELFELIEAAGGRVVLDGTENGERTWPGTFDRDRLAVDPFEELVQAYFGTIPDAFRRPDKLLHEWLGREVVARGVRGVIVHRYVWCDNWHAEVYRLRETLPVPVLDLDGAGARGSGRARAVTRIQAFVEMLR